MTGDIANGRAHFNRGIALYEGKVIAPVVDGRLRTLDAATGKLAWHFQTVHHDLWDYDVATPPALFTTERAGRTLAAVAVGSKTGHLFLLERETGRPLFPVEERPVPASDVPGETAARTQPFPSLPPALAPQRLTADEAWGASEADRQWCREQIQALRSEGIFTPPSLGGTLVAPGNIGGLHWGGVAFAPEEGLLIGGSDGQLLTVLACACVLATAAIARHHSANGGGFGDAPRAIRAGNSEYGNAAAGCAFGVPRQCP
jgi:glucose dehydrogenase